MSLMQHTSTCAKHFSTFGIADLLKVEAGWLLFNYTNYTYSLKHELGTIIA